MTESVSVSSGIASRYASALFELSLEENDIETVSKDISALRYALAVAGDLRALIKSPIVSRDEMAAAMEAIATRIGLSLLMRKTLAVMASKRRLFVLPIMLEQLETKINDHQGVVTAEIISAKELNDHELASLKESLHQASGKKVRFEVKIDESLIGGISARLGSRLVDASIKTKLTNLKNALSEGHQ